MLFMKCFLQCVAYDIFMQTLNKWACVVIFSAPWYTCYFVTEKL